MRGGLQKLGEVTMRPLWKNYHKYLVQTDAERKFVDRKSFFAMSAISGFEGAYVQEQMDRTLSQHKHRAKPFSPDRYLSNQVVSPAVIIRLDLRALHGGLTLVCQRIPDEYLLAMTLRLYFQHHGVSNNLHREYEIVDSDYALIDTTHYYDELYNSDYMYNLIECIRKVANRSYREQICWWEYYGDISNRFYRMIKDQMLGGLLR